MSHGGFGNERAADSPDEDLATFQSRLRRLKREGCNLLVVGDAPRELFAQASESMLGDADARRWRVFGLTDATPESVRDRLPAASATPRPLSETTKLVTHPVGSQRTTDAANPTGPTTTVPGAAIPEVTVEDTDLAEFGRELCSTIETFGARSYRPAEVRLSVDSLAPLLDCYDREEVRRFLRSVGSCVRDWNAMAHYVLPVAYDSEQCQRLADEFDAVVELRTTSECAEERWHLPSSDATMPWVPL